MMKPFFEIFGFALKLDNFKNLGFGWKKAYNSRQALKVAHYEMQKYGEWLMFFGEQYQVSRIEISVLLIKDLYNESSMTFLKNWNDIHTTTIFLGYQTFKMQCNKCEINVEQPLCISQFILLPSVNSKCIARHIILNFSFRGLTF